MGCCGRSMQYGARYSTCAHDNAATCPGELVLVISEVPEAWRKYALEPWRILYPNLDWAPRDHRKA